jgi:heat-inducible transcriptional repressor
MLTEREGAILKSIVRHYIAGAVPVASSRILNDSGLSVSSATIRNDMMHLEEMGYVIRPHHAAGCLPSDAGYRYYVETLTEVELPVEEQLLINHIFYQAEKKLDEWLSLATALTAQMVRAVAIATPPRVLACQFKHVELISIKDQLALTVLVLQGARVRQQLISFTHPVNQPELSAISNKLNARFAGLTRPQVTAKLTELSEDEKLASDGVIKLMEAEDIAESGEPFLDGFHFILGQPEFTQNYRATPLVELAEQRQLVKSIIPQELTARGVQVVIGKENKVEAISNLSVVVSHYGIPQKAVGTLGVVGPTRMSYVRAISTVDYLSSVLSKLVAELYNEE